MGRSAGSCAHQRFVPRFRVGHDPRAREDATREWLEALAANDPVEFDGNAPIVDATDTGELAVGLVNHYYLLRLRAEGQGGNTENHFIPAGDVGSLVMPAGVGVMAATQNPEAAQQFVDFLLAEEAQTYFGTETFEPLIEGVPQPDGVPLLSEIAAPDIDPASWQACSTWPPASWPRPAQVS